MPFDFSIQSFAVTVLSALGFYGAYRFFQKRKLGDGEAVNWSPFEAITITVATYFISQLLAAVGVSIYGAVSGLSDTQLAAQLDGTVPQFVYILAVEALTITLLYILLKRRNTLWSKIGWVRPKFRDVPYALGGFVVYFVTYAFIVMTLVEQFLPQVDTEQRQQLGFETSVMGPELLLIFMSLVILPPLVEEILFRGFLFTGIKNKFPLFTAAVITSVIFAVAHLQWGSGAPLLWAAAIDTFILSMVMVYVRHRSGSLWPSIGIHFIKNGIAFTALFIFKVV